MTKTARSLTGLLLTGLALAPAAHGAAVTGGSLDWTMANVYDSSAAQNTNRTWLGYVTSPPPLASGTATPSAGATGEAVTPTSAKGADKLFTFGFPATSGAYDPATRTGSIELDGVVTFVSQMHGFTISVEDPQLVLSGATGQLFGSGKNSSGSYDRGGGAIFDLDLGAAQVSEDDGVTTIAGIIPAVATEGLVFPSGSRGYAKGSGPDRTPNTFGAFTVTLRTAAEGLTGTVMGKRAAKTVRVTLSRSVGSGAVRLVRAGKVVATGRAAGRKLTLKPKKSKGRYRAIKGAYTLKGKGIAAVRLVIA